MKTIKILTAVAFLSIGSLACSANVYSVARSGGGVAQLPLGDASEMNALQGRSLSPAPRLRIVAPEGGATIAENSVTVKFNLKNYRIGKGDRDKGQAWYRQHVHVILDNQPYKADYDPQGSIVFKDLAPGSHSLMAFCSRNFHLSLKNPGAGHFITFQVEKETPGTVPAAGAPTLIYSRPKGKYSIKGGGAAAVMLDFYLVNVPNFGTRYQVRWTLDGGKPHTVTRWNPVIIGSNLATGEHAVTLELVDKSGNVVPGPYNSVKRTFSVVD